MKPKNKSNQEILEEGRQLISDSEFNELLHEGITTDQKYFETNNVDSFIPQMKIYGIKDNKGKREVSLVQLVNFNKEDKIDMIRTVGEEYYKNKHVAVVIFLTTEAWVSGSIDEKGKPVYQQPSDDPKKQEALITAGLTIDGRSNMSTTKLNRLGKDNVIALGDSIFNDYGSESEIEPFLLRNFYLGYLSEALKDAISKSTTN